MFLDLFYGLRSEGVPVSIQEWKTLLRAVEEDLHGSSLLRFYHLGRSVLVKSETYFDAYDRVFARVFRGVEGAFGDDVTAEILEWLRDPKNFPTLSPEQLGEATQLDLDQTIDETCRNAGEIELVFRPPRRNNVRLLLLMDVGGTMEPFYEPVSQLLTALHDNHGLRDFQPYYFHNCVYDH